MSKFSAYNFSGQKALVRVDFNVPMDENFTITDDTRIKATLPTIKKILNDGGMAILMSHFGRPKEGPDEKLSLKHLIKHLSDLLNDSPGTSQQAPATKVLFVNDCIGEQARSEERRVGKECRS